MSPFQLPLAIVALSALVGCTATTAGSRGLAGTHWTITTIDGQAPAQPDKATMHFEGNRLGANVGCNGIGGDYRIDGGRLVAGPLMATRMFCEGPVWQQEQAVNALLSGAPQLHRDGDRMRLASGGHAIELKRAGP
jgi:heat shock protein HslJ